MGTSISKDRRPSFMESGSTRRDSRSSKVHSSSEARDLAQIDRNRSNASPSHSSNSSKSGAKKTKLRHYFKPSIGSRASSWQDYKFGAEEKDESSTTSSRSSRRQGDGAPVNATLYGAMAATGGPDPQSLIWRSTEQSPLPRVLSNSEMSASSSLEAHGLSDMQNAAENTVFPESGHQRPNDPLYGVDVSWTPKYRSEQMLLDVYTLNNSEKQRRKERDRQQRQHYLLKHTWKGNYGVPLRSPSLIVNWCCGTGIWAMELAHKFPECHVVGIDYPSATMSKLSSAHNNLEFQHMLPHEEHTGLEQFEDNCVDYLMMRDVWLSNSPHHKWRQIMQQVMRILKPGGWLEIYEQDLEIYSAGAHLQTLDRWMDTLLEHLGIEKQLVHLITPLLKETGYQNVQERAMELPLGEWTSTDVMKETGYLFKDLIERRFRILRPWLSELNNVSNEEILNTITQGLDECETSKTHMCWYYYAAQKPGNI